MAALLAGTTLHKSLSTESLSSSSSNDTDVAPPKKYTTQKVDRRPASTFHLKAWKDQTWSERLADKGTMAPEYHELQTETMDRGALPKHSVLYEHAWILSNALPPILLQSLSYYLFPEYKWPVALAFVVYLVSLRILLVRIVQHFGHYALKYGTYDEKVVGRDRTPDHSVGQLAFGFLFFILARLSGEFALAYDKDVSPLSAFKWHYPARAFLWIVVMDLCFYTYHRACHEVDALWFIHQKHHSTRHPSPVLSILADGYQECIEVALVPLLASLTVPMSFPELWLTICYNVYVEILGHTGIRCDWALPITGPILRPLGLALEIEDHDLHHRYGRSGRNYSKGSLIWDRLFGTAAPRLESADAL